MPKPPEPPWKRNKQHQAFAGDIAAAELRNRLALTPDRVPPPPPPVSTVPKFDSSARLVGVIVVATAGVVGYLWGAAPKAIQPPQLALSYNQADSAVPAAYVTTSSLDSRSPAMRPAAADFARGPDHAHGVTNGGMSANAAPAASRLPTPAQPASASLVGRKELQSELSRKSALAPAKPQLRQLGAADIALMVKNGAELMANGYIGAARMIFQPAAEAGDPVAAFALAETYDPLVLKKLGAKGGITPDVALAQNWYEKAMELGSAVAPTRLERLARLPE